MDLVCERQGGFGHARCVFADDVSGHDFVRLQPLMQTLPLQESGCRG